jgi:hypothetical protein
MEYSKESQDATEPLQSLEPAGLKSGNNVRIRPILDGVHLGEVRPNHFVDVVQSPVPEAGISVCVWQNSVGATGIGAVHLGCNTVETATVDNSGNLVWQKQLENRDTVEISSVWGNVGELHLQDLIRNENIGNPGVQWGVVRVTSPDSTQNHFLVAAEFSGAVNNWNVRAGIAAIAAPHSVEELMAFQVPELPSA